MSHIAILLSPMTLFLLWFKCICAHNQIQLQNFIIGNNIVLIYQIPYLIKKWVFHSLPPSSYSSRVWVTKWRLQKVQKVFLFVIVSLSSSPAVTSIPQTKNVERLSFRQNFHPVRLNTWILWKKHALKERMNLMQRKLSHSQC